MKEDGALSKEHWDLLRTYNVRLISIFKDIQHIYIYIFIFIVGYPAPRGGLLFGTFRSQKPGEKEIP